MGSGVEYNFKIKACNSIGCSTSLVFAITPHGKPGEPYNFKRNDANTSSSKVEFSWSDPIKLGGGPITSYQITWDEGIGDGRSVVYDAAYTGGRFLIVTTGITAGTTYKFNVAATNAFGIGLLSGTGDPPLATPLTFAITAGLPSSSSYPYTSYISSTNKIKITWNAITNTSGSPVTYY